VCIVTVFGVWAGVILHDNEAKAAKSQQEILEVHGQQYSWSFDYPRYGLKGITGDAHVPLGQHTTVMVTSSDVIHDFFVSEWRLKIDAVPGQWSSFVVEPTTPGTFLVQCAELCGPGHGPMGLPTDQSGSTASNVIVESPAKFKAWIDRQKKQQQSQSATPGLATFKSNCGGCHKLTKAGTTGASTFPDLDNLAADAKTAGQPLAAYIRESIVDPNKYITPGFPQGIMPQDFGTKLSKTDIDNLVKLLSGGTS
jgi:cytochrome c oxidase subunit 2